MAFAASVVTALVFAIVGWFIARRWGHARWRLGLTVLLGAIVIGQLIEPMSEVILYQHRLGYPDEPERLVAFAQAMAAAVPAYVAALWLCVRQPSVLHAS